MCLKTYKRIHSKPPLTPRTEDEECEHQAERKKKEREVCEAFMNYLSSTGPFADWENNREPFERVFVS